MLVPIINTTKGEGIFFKNLIFFSRVFQKNNINNEGKATYSASTLTFWIVYLKFSKTARIFFSESRPKNAFI